MDIQMPVMNGYEATKESKTSMVRQLRLLQLRQEQKREEKINV
jgi:CheY-like chemotaxis protein